MGKSSGSIWVSLGLKTSEFTKGIKRSRKELNGFQKFGQGLKGMFNPLTVGIGVVAGLGAALTDAFGIIKDFDKANSDLAAVLNVEKDAMKGLTEQAKELGSTTAFTATEVSQLQKEFAKLGFDQSQIRNMTEATLNLAAAAGVELSEAATMAGSTINAFGLKSSDATHIVDAMALSFSSSGLDMEKLSETMKTAAPIARATGVSFEVATAAAGKLADANITGSKAGTDLKNIFSELVKDGKPFQESLNDIANQLNGASTNAEKLAIAEKLVGERAKGSLLILADQKDELSKLSKELENSDGAAQKMADTMLNNLAGDMTIARSTWEGFVLSLEDGSSAIGNFLRGVVQGFTKMVTGLKNLDLIWKDTFSGLGEFTEKELNRTLGGAWETEFGKNITAITDKFDKIPFDKLQKNTEKLEGAWVDLLGEDKQDALILFNQYLKNRVKVEEELKESSEGAAEATKEGTEEVVKMTAEQLKLAEATKKTQKSIDLFAESLLATNYDEMNFGGELKGMKEGDDIFDKIIADAEKNAPEVKLAMTITPPTEDQLNKAKEKMDLLRAQADAVGDSVAGAFSNMSNSMISSLGLANTGMEGFLGGLLKTVTSLISMMLAASISQSIAGATASGTATGPAAVFTTPAFIATAVGGVLGAFAAIPAFADGGIVSGPTMGLMGEYSGAKSNPEVIAPLDKLKSLIPQNDGMGGDVNFKIKGTDLVGVINRTGKSAKYSS